MSEWKESLPEALRKAPFLEKAETLEDATLALTNAAQYMGNAIRIPSEDAGSEQMQEFHQKLRDRVPGLAPLPDLSDSAAVSEFMQQLGKPEEPGKYRAPEVPEYTWNEEALTKAQKLAHDSNMTQEQFSTFLTGMANAEKDATLAATDSHEEALAALKREWGAAYDTRHEAILKLVADTDAPPELQQALRENQLPPATVKWLHSWVEAVSDGVNNTVASQGTNTDHPSITPAEAEAQIADIMANPAYWDRSQPQHKILQDRRMKLEKAMLA